MRNIVTLTKSYHIFDLTFLTTIIKVRNVDFRRMRDRGQTSERGQTSTTRTIRSKVIFPILAILTILFVYQIGIMVDADALTRYYNCTTRVANKNGTLSLQNIENCYDQIFKGAKQAEKDEAETVKTIPPLE
jgi:hypothetical protein